ncbi:MAG TPA: hypothetical protein VIG25_17835 [Pyrinomonadaceae bacterium]|jgi:hypothetical protein
MSQPPDKDQFTPAERRLIDKLDSPAKVQRYFTNMPYNWEKSGGTLRSFREVVKRNEAHCLEAAVAAAVILEQHGYPPLLLDIESWDLLDHVIFVFQQDNLWGSIGRSRDIGLHGRKPLFRSLRALVQSYFEPYVDFTGRIKGYGLANLYDLGDYDWRFSPRRMIKIENHLREMPHKKLKSSDVRYKTLVARYHRYKKRFPNRCPQYYDNKFQWMM